MYKTKEYPKIICDDEINFYLSVNLGINSPIILIHFILFYFIHVCLIVCICVFRLMLLNLIFETFKI